MGAKPAALRSIADNLGGPDALKLTHGARYSYNTVKDQTTHPRQVLSAVCRCKARSYRRTRWGQVSFYEDNYRTDHLPGCPRFGIPAVGGKRTYALAWGGLLKIVSMAVEVTFSIKSGAGAWSLGPHLVAYRMVDELQDPAFALTFVLDRWAFFTEVRSIDNIDTKIIQSYFSRLENAYRSGKSRVTDYTEKSGSILQAILSCRKNTGRDSQS